MNCTFYRPQTTNIQEYENIIGKLYYDFHLLNTGKCEEMEICNYVKCLTKLAKSLDSCSNPKMKFIGLDNPKEMPPDARVEFFYQPTYIATAFIIKSIITLPYLFDKGCEEIELSSDDLKNSLFSLMLGCTGRDFNGKDVLSVSDVIDLFEKSNIGEFFKKYPLFCPKFKNCFLKAKKYL